ncbi:MAG: dihydroorotase [Flavobacteriales bacterium]|nr:dihydroorotase [Flavobacteriales bacterium]
MSILLKGGRIVNDGKIIEAAILLNGKIIEKIGPLAELEPRASKIIDVSGKYIFPGLIDDQVHFREPGLTHKGDIHSESRAAVAGGITSFMEMPNTVPNVLTQGLLQDKYDMAEEHSMANYSFYMGASNDNLDEVKKTDPKNVCGLKIFMGSSTGNMLVDNENTLRGIFAECEMLIASHCEDEATIRANSSAYKSKYGADMPIRYHSEIRSAEACYRSSSFAASLADNYGARLHILHLSSAREMSIFDNNKPLEQKKLTAEACVHHLWFSNEDYDTYGTRIKWNPAVKSKEDREGIWQGVLNDKIDIIATDHAPHTAKEKSLDYWRAPSGGPLVQHALVSMLDHYHNGKISLERIAEKMCHSPARLFKVHRRGYIKEGFSADLVVVDLNSSWEVSSSNVLYKCGWSPFEGHSFKSKVVRTFINGQEVYTNLKGAEVGSFNEEFRGERLVFEA